MTRRFLSFSKNRGNKIIVQTYNRCYLNCKPKVATSLVMSLKVKCTSCSTSDEENAEYKWNLMKYDPVTKTETALTGWENWLETGKIFVVFFWLNGFSFRRHKYQKEELSLQFQIVTETTEQKFVVKANSFIGLSYYMLTVRMNVSDESWSEMRMILETTAPPYDGHCFVYNVSNSGNFNS